MRWAPLLLIGAAVFGVYAWSSQFWLDMVDEGYFLDLASRVYEHGALPYRDFDTYYTPGIFYLFSGAFHVFGVSVLPIRLVMAAIRAICAVLLLRLTLRVAPWPFAILPLVAVTALDNWPIEPEPHPSWPSMTACLLTLEMVALHQSTGRLRWLVLAGASAALAFVFKQNMGAFSVLGVAGYVLLRHRADVGLVARGLQAVFGVTVVLAVTALLWDGLTRLSAVALWLPVPAALGIVTYVAWRSPLAPAVTAGVRPIVTEGLAAGAAFVVVTVAWLLPLTIALGGPANTPYGLFVGDVNQGALAAPFLPPSAGVPLVVGIAVWVLALVAVLPGAPSARWRWPLLGLALVASVALQQVPLMGVSAPYPPESQLAVRVRGLNDGLGSLFLYLPAMAAIAASAGLILQRSRLCCAGPVTWYLLFGVLAGLSMYPRADVLHMVGSGPPVFAAGAWALARAHRAMTGGGALPRQAAAFAALVLIPLAAVAPQAAWRYAALVDPSNLGAAEPYVPLAVERAPVRLPQSAADTIGKTVEFLQRGIPAGEPLFVFPMAPLFNFLTDRPSPARFNHYLPGALTDDDMTEVIDDLEAARPRYVLWDHGGVVYWETDPAYRRLSDYIWQCYGIAATFDRYLVLERHC